MLIIVSRLSTALSGFWCTPGRMSRTRTIATSRSSENRCCSDSSSSSRPTSSKVTLDPTMQNVLMLAVLVLVRTFLSWSLIEEIEGTGHGRPHDEIDTGTRLAVDRTRLAHERTLMAWVRTATSLISFGFTIYKFFEFEMSKQPLRAVPLWAAEATRTRHDTAHRPGVAGPLEVNIGVKCKR